MARSKVMVERWKHRNAFETYLLMGPGRSLRKLMAETNISFTSLEQWSRSFNWDARVVERERQAMAKISKQNDETLLKELKIKHVSMYQEVQKKAIDGLTRKKDRLKFRDAKDAAIALDIGIKGERDAVGLNDTKFRGGIIKDGFAAMVEAVCGPNA